MSKENTHILQQGCTFFGRSQKEGSMTVSLSGSSNKKENALHEQLKTTQPHYRNPRDCKKPDGSTYSPSEKIAPTVLTTPTNNTPITLCSTYSLKQIPFTLEASEASQKVEIRIYTAKDQSDKTTLQKTGQGEKNTPPPLAEAQLTNHRRIYPGKLFKSKTKKTTSQIMGLSAKDYILAHPKEEAVIKWLEKVSAETHKPLEMLSIEWAHVIAECLYPGNQDKNNLTAMTAQANSHMLPLEVISKRYAKNHPALYECQVDLVPTNEGRYLRLAEKVKQLLLLEGIKIKKTTLGFTSKKPHRVESAILSYCIEQMLAPPTPKSMGWDTTAAYTWF